ncbi:hypothetical protein DEU56DRAFT_530038 [Suillus clintonianus]|uniref:uncharacterized protein n=1 Tax=Suillus clintonianus TaxID=1904413 RepID=UPI001B8696A2|nr:uncharacterized protein DEU56DRAFT_530038 [Suillus clintonianus]KAG2127529.1 hypothetical protein DEU56DRAFT_530038 [Suillus clintonianus]
MGIHLLVALISHLHFVVPSLRSLPPLTELHVHWQGSRTTSLTVIWNISSEARLRDADERERKDVRWRLGGGVILILIMVMMTKMKMEMEVEVVFWQSMVDLDPDLEPSLKAMKGFVQSMSAEGSRYRTMDDTEDEQRMRIEDEEEDDGSDFHGAYSDTNDEENK